MWKIIIVLENCDHRLHDYTKLLWLGDVILYILRFIIPPNVAAYYLGLLLHIRKVRVQTRAGY
jgi:hypothetical protein